MGNNAVKNWLRKKAAGDAAASFFLAALAFAAGMVVLTITFFFTYAMVWFGFNFGVSILSQLLFNNPLRISHPVILLVCSAFLVLLFVGNARTSREDPGTLPDSDDAPFILPSGLVGGLAGLLPYSDASSRTIADWCFTGPRLLVAAWSSFKKTWRLARLELSRSDTTSRRRRASPRSVRPLSPRSKFASATATTPAHMRK